MRSLIVALFPLLLLTGCEKYALDRQMAKLCKEDGGLTIYEKVQLPADRFDEKGKVKWWQLPDKKRAEYADQYGPEYKVELSSLTIKNGDPVRGQGLLRKLELKLIRLSDQKLMAIQIAYARSGGDFIYMDHYNSKLCPITSESLNDVFYK